MTREQEQAARLLKSYLKTALQAAGLRDSDNDAEIETLVECLIDASTKSALERVHEEELDEEIPQSNRAYYKSIVEKADTGR